MTLELKNMLYFYTVSYFMVYSFISIITEQALSPQFFYILRNHRLSNTPFLSNIPIALCISFGLIVRRDLQERHHPTIKKMRNIPRFLLVESNLLLVIGEFDSIHSPIYILTYNYLEFQYCISEGFNCLDI